MNMKHMVLLATLALAFQGSAVCNDNVEKLKDMLIKHREVAAFRFATEHPGLANKKSRSGLYPLFNVQTVQMVKLLIKQGADVNARGRDGLTALIWMSDAGAAYHKVIRYLIERGADVNAKDKDGYTALRNAQDAEDYVLIKILKNAGAR